MNPRPIIDRRAFLTATVAAPLLDALSPANSSTDQDAFDRAVTARVKEQYDRLVQHLADEPDLAAAVPLPPMDILLPVARWIYPQHLQAADGQFVAFWGRTRTRAEAEDLAIYMAASECERNRVVDLRGRFSYLLMSKKKIQSGSTTGHYQIRATAPGCGHPSDDSRRAP